MSAGTNSVRRVVTLLASKPTFDTAICKSCQETLSRRGYSSAAAATTTSAADPSSSSPEPPSSTTSTPSTVTSQSSSQPAYTVRAGIVLSRAPQITRDLTPFEKSFYFYQRRLNERLALPFTKYFYFKRGTPADVEWKRKYKERQTAAKDIGNYNAYSKDAWNDELLVGAIESEPEHQVEALIADAEGFAATEAGDSGSKKEEIPRPLSRLTEADQKGDYKSLDRLLQRTLYLLVQAKEGYWKFPSVVLEGKENLRTAAERGLFQSAGPNMNMWMIGYHPIGHYVSKSNKAKTNPETGVQILGEKTFFMKGRIMAGQADLSASTQGIADFKWLAKEEIQQHVNPHYWSAIKNMLAER
ncbi:hypothetical protein CPC735_017940 [Coccidioides posadasii C735 delta SOWgp]|uniref:Large ribosomal subunit protein mL46 n=1 Tax=Coccidioides posadasii (strain C735) TaxID=222929 RepID=C5PDN0_COCP7|nr:mitochondrial 54S ribosomal protein YmL17/YmL30 [Coccidioides posadasii C735 delta SOWgp]EER25191.1 hypothetical protein CPC735_017940 [Coccidioides posadasii C735 delta SOWgp]|eukprot:XP_003067336.1 mitochondrial 54S ribosomal protein YmL17/YmL30 [Coccidioides posadasii C735 delta SOWgp]